MRHTGIDIIGDVPWGTHFCQFYETHQDLIETLVPYFRAGLGANEFCMWVTSEPLQSRAARVALKAAVPDLDGRIRRGQIEIIDYKKWYVRSGKFSAEEVLAGWADKLEAALAKGYDGLRLSGNTFWLEKADWEDFRKYEEAVDNIIGRRRMMAMCTYSLQKCGASEIIDVVANHEFALIKRQGRWEIIESSARKQAEEKIRRRAEEDIRYQAFLLGQVDDGIIGADADSRITYWNKGAERIYGYTEAEVLGKTTRELLRPTYGPGEREEILENLQLTGTSRATIRTKHKDGTLIMAEVDSTRLTDESGAATGYVVVYRDVTERQRMEEALRESERRYHHLVKYAPTAIYEVDFHTRRFASVNDAMCEVTGFSREELLAMDALEVLDEPSRILFQERIRKWSVGVKPDENVEYGVLAKDGRKIYALLNVRFTTDVDGRPRGATVVAQDITERKRAEEELRRTREHLENLIDYANAPIIVWDPDFHITLFNHAFERLTKLKAEEVIGRPLDILFPASSRDESLAHIKRTLAGERWETVEIPILSAAGAIRTVLWNSANIFDKGGTTISATIAQGQDITERKRAEEELHQRSRDLQLLTETLEQRVLLRTAELEEANELLQAEVTHSYFIEADLKQQQESLQTVIDNIPVMLCFFDSSGRARLANREFKKLLGWSEKETELKAFGRGSGEAGLPESRDQQAGGIPGWRNLRVRTSAGTEMDTSWAAVRLSDGGRIDIGLDMRERREAERERLRLAAAVEQASEGVAITDSTGIISYVNSAFEETTGTGRAGLVGRRYFDILGGQADCRELAAEAQKSVESGASWSAHLSRKKPTDQSCELDIRITPIRDGSGKIINHLVVERDVTGEFRLQQHLRQAQKLEALGTLAGGIAHDFNNILNPIFINTELVLLDAALDDESRRELELGLKAAERGRDLVRQIITFSRQKERERKPSKVGPVVKEALKFLRSTLAATIEIREHLEPETGFIMADPSQIHQIIMNLCNNSAYAMQATGGVLEVDLAEVEADAEMALRHPDIKPGPFLKLTVTDTGTGMTPEVMERVFDPFFTTKRPGEGSGMGLAVVHGIVRDYAGAVTIHSEVGKGTTFNIFLPRVPSKDVAAGEAPAVLPKGRERILLVDDEEAQVESIGNMLKRLGHEVVSKTDPEEALESFRQDPSRFDLVITDQTMPKLTGAHLAEKILRQRPGLPVILCTGFSDKVDANAAHDLGIAGFLMKPFSIREMTAAINQALKKA